MVLSVPLLSVIRDEKQGGKVGIDITVAVGCWTALFMSGKSKRGKTGIPVCGDICCC